MIDLDVRIIPPQVARDYAGLARDVRSFHEPMKRSVQQVMAPSLRLNFEVGGRPGWVPLAAATLEKKSRKGQPEDILIATGVLRRKAGQLNLWKITRTTAEIMLPNDIQYAVFHMTGTNKMPAREWAIIQPEDADAITEVFDRWIRERAARRGWVG